MASFAAAVTSNEVNEEHNTCDDNCYCSYAISGEKMLSQPLYVCMTCPGGQDRCICEGCANACHSDHEVEYLAYGRGYCDCGAANCQLLQDSLDLGQQVLALNSGKTIGQDINGRIEINMDMSRLPSFSPFIIQHNGLPPSTTRDDPLSSFLIQYRQACIDLTKISKDTFWINCQDQPRCPFEEMALKIFHHHTYQVAKMKDSTNCPFDVTISGAEWWIQTKYYTATDGSDIEGNNRAHGIDLHYDKDEEIGALFNVGVFPHISTVTYLSGNRSDLSTLIVDYSTSQPVGCEIPIAYISDPKFGKHIAFDGRYLHGAPSELNPEGMTYGDEPRVTFLVNIWLNHHPAKISPISETILSQLPAMEGYSTNEGMIETIQLQSTATASKQVSFTTKHVMDDVANEHGEWKEIPFVSDKAAWGKGEDELGIYLRIFLPPRDYDSSNNTIINYKSKQACATLEYETDEEEYSDEGEGEGGVGGGQEEGN